MLQRRTKDVACAQNKQNYHFHPLISNQLLTFPKTDEFRAKILNFSLFMGKMFAFCESSGSKIAMIPPFLHENMQNARKLTLKQFPRVLTNNNV